MEVLPNEILNKIFGLLSKKDILPIRLLSKRMQIFAEYMLSTMYFSFENVNHILDFLNITSWRNSANTILTPYQRFNIKIGSKLSKDILEEFISKYGNVIRGLIIDDIQPIENIFNILMNTPNIEELHIRVSLYTNEALTFSLPKLKVLGFGHGDINPLIVKHILSSSPNLQEVELKITEITKGNTLQDFTNMFQFISTRGIEVKLHINLSTVTDSSSLFRRINSHTLKEIIKIPFRICELILEISEERMYITNADLTEIQELIEELIHNQSRNLKHMNLKCGTATNEDVHLSLDFKNLKNLHSLEVSGKISEYYKVLTLIEVKLGHVPLLNKVRIKAAKLSFEQPVPQLKHLNVCSNKVFLCLSGIGLNDETFQLEKLSLMYLEKLLTTKLTERRVQQLNHLLFTQAKYVKQLEIGAINTMGMDKLQFMKMDNLKRLELNLHEVENNNKVKLQQIHFPHLEILSLNTPFEADYNKSMENVHTLIIKSASFSDFQKCRIIFPKLRKLQIIYDIDDKSDVTNGFLPFIFQNMTHIKELYIERGGSWDEFTGNSQIVNNFEDTTTNWTLNTSIPNLGSMKALEILNLGEHCAFGDNHILAVPYLILCGKLPNLKYFDAKFTWQAKKKLIPSIVKICDSNNTKTNFCK